MRLLHLLRARGCNPCKSIKLSSRTLHDYPRATIMESHILGHPDKLILLPSHTQHTRTCDPVLSSWERHVHPRANTKVFSSVNGVDGSASFPSVLRKFSVDIRKMHKRRILWPKEELSAAADVKGTFKDDLLVPIVDLFNQLRAEVLDDMEIKVHASTCNHALTYEFFSDDFRVFRMDTPLDPLIVVFMDVPCRLDDGSFSSCISDLLDEGWKMNSMSKILVTDLRSLFIFHPPDEKSGTIKYESKHIDHRLEVLRVCIAAYLHSSLPEDCYLLVPIRPNYMNDIKPSGVPVNPETPLDTDEIVFRNSHRHSDFDYYSLTRDRDRALQFFRWRTHVKNTVKLKHVSTGASLRCETNGFRKMHCTYKPVYGVEELPKDTKDHIEMSKRPNFDSDFLSTFRASESFSVELLEDFTIASSDLAPELSISRTYKCRITEIDGRPVDFLPPVLVKLYDDRFYQMDKLVDPPPNVSWWFFSYTTAEDHVRREMAAYEKMDFAQGSLIPYFYGAHKFVLPDGHELFGIILEFVSGKSLTGGGAVGLSNEMQLQFIQSTRHALRALQYSDVSQLDWHGGQILCLTASTSAKCVLVDFATSYQTLDSNFDPGNDDYASCLSTLLDSDHGLDRNLVWSNFGERETWDVKRYGVEDNGKSTIVGGPDPFAFIYDLPA